MSQKDENTRKYKKKHLAEKDWYQTETLVKSEKKEKEIAEILRCSKRIIERELKRGKVTRLTSGYEYFDCHLTICRA